MEKWMSDVKERDILPGGGKKSADLKHGIEKSEDFNLGESTAEANGKNSGQKTRERSRPVNQDVFGKNASSANSILITLSVFLLAAIIIFLFALMVLKTRIGNLENRISMLESLILNTTSNAAATIVNVSSTITDATVSAVANITSAVVNATGTGNIASAAVNSTREL